MKIYTKVGVIVLRARVLSQTKRGKGESQLHTDMPLLCFLICPDVSNLKTLLPSLPGLMHITWKSHLPCLPIPQFPRILKKETKRKKLETGSLYIILIGLEFVL